jgi:hypothetical protein
MMRERDMDIDMTKDMVLDTYNRHGHGYQAWTRLPGMDMVTRHGYGYRLFPWPRTPC